MVKTESYWGKGGEARCRRSFLICPENSQWPEAVVGWLQSRLVCRCSHITRLPPPALAPSACFLPDPLVASRVTRSKSQSPSSALTMSLLLLPSVLPLHRLPAHSPGPLLPQGLCMCHSLSLCLFSSETHAAYVLSFGSCSAVS